MATRPLTERNRIETMTDAAAQIVLRGVSKSYNSGGQSRLVLENVDLTIEPGAFVVIVGRSGSGKSTLLNLIAGLDHPDQGEIMICQCPLSALNETGRALFRRRNMGFVFQFFNLIPTLTVAENVLLPLQLNGCKGDEARRRCGGALAEVGLGKLGERFPEELSGGEQQRVAVARALVHGPAFVLADEPTGNLDLQTALEIIEILDNVCRKKGATLIMATHSPEVIGLADRVLTIRDGQLLESVP
jgi:putative ABC transport system ATP-binding protein